MIYEITPEDWRGFKKGDVELLLWYPLAETTKTIVLDAAIKGCLAVHRALHFDGKPGHHGWEVSDTVTGRGLPDVFSNERKAKIAASLYLRECDFSQRTEKGIVRGLDPATIDSIVDAAHSFGYLEMSA